jgi:hypothetical protein
VVNSTGCVRRLTAGATVVLLALGGCGGSDEPGDEPATAVATETSPGPSSQPPYAVGTPASPAEQQPATMTATLVDFGIELGADSMAAGRYSIEVVNDGGASHDFVVERDGEEVAASEVLDPGGTTTLDVTLAPGTYIVYCSIANHRAMGMETTIEVT